MKSSNLYKGSLSTIIVVKIGNRVRKYYKLTEAGTKETVEKLAELESYIRNMRALVNPKFRFES